MLNICTFYIVTGVCPYDGFILLILRKPLEYPNTQNVFRTWYPDHIGTFCNDGTFTVPLYQKLYKLKSEAILVKYSLFDDSNMHVAIQYLHEQLEQFLDVNTCPFGEVPATCKLDGKYTNMSIMADQPAHLLFFFNFKLYEEHRINLVSFNGMPLYSVYASIQPILRNCDKLIRSKLAYQINTTIKIMLHDEIEIELSQCGSEHSTGGKIKQFVIVCSPIHAIVIHYSTYKYFRNNYPFGISNFFIENQDDFKMEKIYRLLGASTSPIKEDKPGFKLIFEFTAFAESQVNFFN